MASPSSSPSFASRLLAWWDAHGRKDLPWQRHRTPYRVWVSEIMLQQTQARTAAPYFERFVARFPDLASLATADMNEVLHLWSGLGYYARARNLHCAAVIVAGRHGGALPRVVAELEALPGIGRSTAAAIVALAHNTRAPILDANAKRLLTRHFRVRGAPSQAATRRELWALAEATTPPKRAADYTQAVMDVGAIVCRPRRPRCAECPVRGTCRSLALGEADAPPCASRRVRRLERRRFFVLIDQHGACYVEQRPANGLWGGLWSPPERGADESVEEFLAAAGVRRELLRVTRVSEPFRHGFSHFDLDVKPVYLQLRERPTGLNGEGVWITAGKHRLGLSAVAAKLLDEAVALGSQAARANEGAPGVACCGGGIDRER